ncbi:unnamed protein product [Cladocopium goreaui]|uniref:Dockerin domain-containing protein n=1 Tax=Cladocopium goreaui TaxID=2562237 RepID=A0A9P1CA65_9DINO|nr:unnamed protein product [Cladocopium goreaui]CAI3987751.1 unnamed protein product [Cladocopium goreaui]
MWWKSVALLCLARSEISGPVLVPVRELKGCCPDNKGQWHSCCSVAGSCCPALDEELQPCCPGFKEQQLFEPCIGINGRSPCPSDSTCCSGSCCVGKAVCCGKTCCTQESSCCKDSLGDDVLLGLFKLAH